MIGSTATRVGLATKLPGPVVEIIPRKGDIVEALTIVASFDATEIGHQPHQPQADAQQARQLLATPQAVVANGVRFSMAALFVMSDGASLITGTDLAVDE